MYLALLIIFKLWGMMPMAGTLTTHYEGCYKYIERRALKLNKYKCNFRCKSVPFFDESISWVGIIPDPRKLKALTNMAPPPNSERT